MGRAMEGVNIQNSGWYIILELMTLYDINDGTSIFITVQITEMNLKDVMLVIMMISFVNAFYIKYY